VRAVLAALVCLALGERPLLLTEVTRLLFSQLSPASRQLLGVPGTAPARRAFLAACRRVRCCFSQADGRQHPQDPRLACTHRRPPASVWS
jgi:hypothetical protein